MIQPRVERGRELLEALDTEDVRDLGPQDLAALRAYLDTDLFAFCWLVFGYHELLVPEVHGPICRFVEKWGEPGWRRLMCAVPRDIGKTSVVTRGGSLWMVTRDPDNAVAIFNEKEANSQKWVKHIREVVEGSKVFQAIYRDLLPPGLEAGSVARRWKWSDTELQFQRGKTGRPEASITGLGVTSATTGGHWTHILKDDILSFEASRSPIVMEMVKEWVDAARNLESPAQKGCDLFVFTPWHFNDAYAYNLEKYGDEYKLYRRSALENGKSIHPAKWTTEELLKMQERDPYNFASQYMCTPMAGKDTSFQREWLRFGKIVPGPTGERFRIRPDSYDPEAKCVEVAEPAPQSVALHSLHAALLVDPAPSEDGEKRREPGARNALVVLGMDAWGRKLLLDVWVGRPDPLDVIRKMLAMAKEWALDLIAIEKVLFSVLYRHWLWQEADRARQHVTVKDLTPERRSKDARILAMIPDFRSGIYYLNEGATDLDAFIQEFIQYPYAQTRDILDAMGYGDDVLRRPDAPEEIEERMRRDHTRESGRDAVTGY